MELNRLKNPQEVEKLADSLNAAHIGYELVLTDNIDEDWANTDCDNSWTTQPVKVVGASIVVCIRGSVSYRINLSDYTVNEGEVLIILPGSIMQVTNFNADTKISTISFASSYYEPIVDVDPQMREMPIVSPAGSDLEEIMGIYRNLASRLSQNADKTAKAIAKGYITVICTILFDYWSKNNPQCDCCKAITRPNELYYRFLAKVQEEYKTHHSVKYYADSLCVTPKYLSMVVKRQSGRNASEFIDEMIIFESKALLNDERYTVQQVSDMMHFPNPSFFAKFFKQRCGLSPTSYKKGLPTF